MRSPLRRARLRSHLKHIVDAGIAAVDPAAALRRTVRRTSRTIRIGSERIRLTRQTRLHILGLGKPAPAMAQELVSLSQEYVVGGVVVTKHEHGFPIPSLKVYEAGHPVPDRYSVAGSRAMLQYAHERVTPGDHVVVAIGGGASATCCAPAPGITLKDKRRVTDLLLRTGAAIQEMNAVRKHLSAIKGGHLGAALAHAHVHTVLISDVIGDDPSTIGSGPTVPDSSTFAEAWAVLERYELQNKVPLAVKRHLEAGVHGQAQETVKNMPASHTAQLLATNTDAVNAASVAARANGYHPLVLSTSLSGETRDAAIAHAAIAREVRTSGRPAKAPVALISGGETTVRLGSAAGLGGRNQEFVLALLDEMATASKPFAAASIGTDGTDGPTDAAGAVCDDRSLARALALGLPPATDALRHHDSYPWFDALGDLVKTGPTGTNVMDLRIILLPG